MERQPKIQRMENSIHFQSEALFETYNAIVSYALQHGGVTPSLDWLADHLCKGKTAIFHRVQLLEKSGVLTKMTGGRYFVTDISARLGLFEVLLDAEEKTNG